MKIGFDAKRAFNNYSGLGNYSRFVINGFSEFYPGDEYYLYTPQVDDQLDSLVTRTAIKQMPIGALGRAFKSLWRTYGIASMAQSEGLNIYHGLSNELPHGISKTSVKSIVTIHDLIFLRYPELYKKVDRKIYNKKFKSACVNSDMIVAISEQTKSDIIDYYNIDPKKIAVVYQDCSNIYHQKVADELKLEAVQKYSLPSKYILCVGTIEKRKNQLSLVKAFCEIETDHHLVLVGRKTNYSSEITEYLEKSNRGNNVIFLESVDQKHLPAIYSQATIFVYPSLFEGFGIPIIEAQNIGTPVITSTGSCFKETGGDGAIYIDPKNIDQIKKEISTLLDDGLVRETLSSRGKENCKKFRAEVTIPQLYNIYKSLL